jgi:hypothetical protein
MSSKNLIANKMKELNNKKYWKKQPRKEGGDNSSHHHQPIKKIARAYVAFHLRFLLFKKYNTH